MSGVTRGAALCVPLPPDGWLARDHEEARTCDMQCIRVPPGGLEPPANSLENCRNGVLIDTR